MNHHHRSAARAAVPDISGCESEPIRVPGSVQPHGVLFAVREADWVVTHVSENARLASVGAHAVAPGSQLREAVGDAAADAIAVAASSPGGLTHRAARVTRHAPSSGGAFDVLAHRHDGRLVLEFEPAAAEVDLSSGRLSELLAEEAGRLTGSRSTAGLCAAAAAAVRRISGFDKVMVYRFDEDWHGTVLAEDGPAEMDAYLGLRFPASDIPAQARELYRLNPVRLIADVDYLPSPLLAVPAAGGVPLDLTYATLRSVSPVHVEYLRNMNVEASMSVSVIRDGRLWGLIACHHRAPRFASHAVRSAAEVVATLLAQLLAQSDAIQDAAYASDVRAVQWRLIRHVADREHLADALAERADDLLRVADADGVVFCVDGECHLLGGTPSAEDVARLAGWLAGADRPVFHTRSLADEYPEAERFRDRASGLLALTLSSVYRNYVMWFRSEEVREVRWAGNPDKAVDAAAGGGGPQRLHPRKSFEAWTEQVGRRSRPWRAAELEAAASLREALVDAILRKAEEAAARAKDQFLAVLSHELRTPLSPVLTAASALEQDAALPAEVREMMRMIRRNVELETRLIDDLLDLTRISKGKLVLNMETLDVHALVARTVEVCERDLHEKGIRLTVHTDAAAHHVEGDPARLQQVLWNILKNAVKFTPPGGTIAVRTVNSEGARLRVEVADSGVGIDPAVLPGIFNAFEQGGRTVTSRYGGLGLGLAIAKTLVEVHRGRIAAASAGKGHGATFTVELPTAAAARPAAVPGPSAATEAGDAATAAAGRPRSRILLVEDHKDTARTMARLLEKLDYEIRIADSLAAARALAAAHKFELVISDLGLPDGSGNDLMRELRGRHGVPGIALTGWGMEDDVRQTREAGFARHVTKPVNFQLLATTIREVINEGKTGS